MEYMASEYALWGYLTYKADVYSFGVVALEIVSGKNNSSYAPAPDIYCTCLLDWIKVSLLCTNATPSLRPTMSEVVNMLEGKTPIPDMPDAGSYSQDLRFKALRDHERLRPSRNAIPKQNQYSMSASFLEVSSSTSGNDLYEINEESYLKFKVNRDGCNLINNSSSEVPLSTTMPSWTRCSSTSTHDLYNINSSA